MWSLSNWSIGEIQSYTLYNDNGNKRRVFQNFLDAEAGDIAICYEATPTKQVVALAKIYKRMMENLSISKRQNRLLILLIIRF